MADAKPNVKRADDPPADRLAMLRELAAVLVSRGYGTMSLGVVRGNAGAGRLYLRLGATLLGVEPAEWAAGVDHEIYRWRDLAQLALGPYNPAR